MEIGADRAQERTGRTVSNSVVKVCPWDC